MMRTHANRLRPQLTGANFAIAVGLLLLTFAQSVWAERAWSRRLYLNAYGDLVLVGNTLSSCTTGAANCAAARNGTDDTLSNADFTPMPRVDQDGDGSTTNSSSADLAMPVGSTVRWAGLYWSGKHTDPPPVAAQTMWFRTPTSGYQTVTATSFDSDDSGGAIGFGYQGFADVTALVAAGGNGTYWGAEVYSTTTSNSYSGWNLIIVYENASLPFRNFAVYDGFLYINNQTVNLPVTGFLTPLSGPIVTQLGVLLWDGDRDGSGAGEGLSLNGTFLTNAVNPTNNQWNGTISDQGVHVTAKNPNYVNQLGMDVDRYNLPSGILVNGATSATIGIGSPAAAEAFWTGAASFMTDIYVPIIVPNVVKTAVDVNGGDLLTGDVLRWNVLMTNTGLDAGVNLVATDNIPAFLTYVPGSLNIVTGANAGTKSDTAANDQAEYVSTGTPRVVFRLGTGADGVSGGSLAYNQSTSFEFDTTVDPAVPSGTLLTNAVQIQYSGQTIGDVFSASSAAATASVLGPPSITKSFTPNVIDTGQASVLAITVVNPTGNPAALTGVTFSDTYPSGLVNAATPNAQVNCTPGSTAGTITGGNAGGNTIGMSPGATLALNGSCTVTVNVTSSTIGNYTNTTSPVTSTNGGTGATGSSSILSVGKPRITKALGAASIVSGGTTTVTFTINNLAATALTSLAFSDTLTGMEVGGTPGVVNSCGGTVTAVAASTSISLAGGSLAALGSCTISVTITSTTMGVHTNTTTGVSSTESGVAGNPSNTVTLTVIAPPVLTKSFFPPSVRINVPSTMTLTLTNPNTTTTVTGAAFTDGVSPAYPANVLNSSPSAVALSCTAGSSATLSGGAAGGSNVGLTSGTLAPLGSCTITINVQSTTTGSKLNTTSTIATTNAGTGTAASTTLDITTLVAPTVTKVFGTSPITITGNSVMTITLSNSNATAVNGVQFTDNFPSGLVIHSTPGLGNTCGGTATGVAGTAVLSLTGGTIPGTGSCAVNVTVASPTTSAYLNSTGTIITTNGGTFGPATATLQVLAPPRVAKSFSIDNMALAGAGGESTLTLTLSNPTTATTSLTGVAVLDPFPPGLIVDTPISGFAAASTCDNAPFSGTIGEADAVDGDNTLEINDASVRVTGVTLAPNTSCTVVIDVSAAAAGSFVNTTNAPTSTNGGNGTAATATVSAARPDINKSFCANPIAAGATCVMTVTITNPTGAALTTAAFTDTYPTNMTNTGTPNGTLSGAGCLGTVTAAANGGSLALSGGTIPTTGCTITVNINATQTVTNTIAAGAFTSSGGTNANPATATLNIYIPPVVAKSFAASTILLNGTTTMTIRLTNLNAVNATTVTMTDTFPSEGVATGPFTLASATVGNTCGGTVQGRTGTGDSWGTPAIGDTALRNLTGTINSGSFCEITATVTGTTAGSYNNSTGSVGTANIGTGTADSAVLVVMGPPTVTKSFTPNSVLTNEVSLLTITLTNPNTTTAITGAALTDTYPAGLVNDATPNATTSCTGGTASATAGSNTLTLSGGSIAANSSCTVTVRVISASAGSYNNTTGTVTTTNAGNGTAANAILTVSLPMPSLSITKLSAVLSDPINNASNAKAIPGALIEYTISVTNTGPGTVDNNTMVITDPIPVPHAMYVNSLGIGGPIIFANGSPSSGLAWTFTALNNGADSIDFSEFTSGADWTYSPTPDGNGFDANVKRIRLKPTGVMSAAGGGNPSFTAKFRALVQ